MMSTPRVMLRMERREAGNVAFLTVSNAKKLNALDTKLMDELIAAVEALAADEVLRVLIVTGAGNQAFIGGADIDEMAALDPHSARAFITRVHRCCSMVRDLPVPVVARLNGFALGAGLELAAACDLRVAADTAKIGMPEVKLGMPSVVEAALLPRLVGWGRARELMLLGEIHTAREAASWGLIERVVPQAQLDEAVESMIGSILAAAPRAVRLQKRLIRAWEDMTLSDAVDAGIEAYVTAFATNEAAGAIARFKAARKRGRR
jgi:enoyl-CoA hydratase